MESGHDGGERGRPVTPEKPTSDATKRAMERVTEERRGEGALVNYSPCSAVVVGGGYQA